MSNGLRFFGLLITCLLVLRGPDTAYAEKQITTPPPISGRQITEPGSITAGDVMARLLLTHQTLEQIRIHMGKPAPPQPLIEVSEVKSLEVYFAALNLYRRGLRFGFERLRTTQDWETKPSLNPNQADTFLVIDGILSVALHVKHALGIETIALEHPQPETITSAEVFNQILTTGALLNKLLAKRTSPDDNFGILTFSVGQALQLHSHFSRKLMPDEGVLEKNKTPEDVLVELKTTFEELRRLGALVNVSMLTIKRTGIARPATPDDVSEILVLIAAELGRILIKNNMNPEIDGAWVGAGQFPSHNVRRVKMLRQILSETADAVKRMQ